MTTQELIEKNSLPVNAAKRIWVLGSSLGGPLAVKEFLSKLPDDLPIAFLLAQHIGANHLELLAEQLDRATVFHVTTAKSGHTIKNQEVILVPIKDKMVIDSNGQITLEPLEKISIYTPSIDAVMKEVAEQFGSDSGAIIFSGMGNDGEQACRIVVDHGGVVWAQDAESCVISSMPDNARKTGSGSMIFTWMNDSGFWLWITEWR